MNSKTLFMILPSKLCIHFIVCFKIFQDENKWLFMVKFLDQNSNMVFDVLDFALHKFLNEMPLQLIHLHTKCIHIAQHTPLLYSGCQCKFGQIFFHHLHVLTQANATSIHERENIPFSGMSLLSGAQKFYLGLLKTKPDQDFPSQVTLDIFFCKQAGNVLPLRKIFSLGNDP